jgi:hypothetical protein
LYFGDRVAVLTTTFTKPDGVSSIISFSKKNQVLIIKENTWYFDFEVCGCLELFASFVPSLCLFGSDADAE